MRKPMVFNFDGNTNTLQVWDTKEASWRIVATFNCPNAAGQVASALNTYLPSNVLYGLSASLNGESVKA